MGVGEGRRGRCPAQVCSQLAGAAKGRAPSVPALPPCAALLVRQEDLPAGSGRQAQTDPQILPDGSSRDHRSCS